MSEIFLARGGSRESRPDAGAILPRDGDVFFLLLSPLCLAADNGAVVSCEVIQINDTAMMQERDRDGSHGAGIHRSGASNNK